MPPYESGHVTHVASSFSRSSRTCISVLPSKPSPTWKKHEFLFPAAICIETERFQTVPSSFFPSKDQRVLSMEKRSCVLRISIVKEDRTFVLRIPFPFAGSIVHRRRNGTSFDARIGTMHRRGTVLASRGQNRKVSIEEERRERLDALRSALHPHLRRGISTFSRELFLRRSTISILFTA